MLRAVAEGVTLAVRAQPGAKRTAIAGIYGEGTAAQLKIAVQAQPIEGRANEALIAFLADVFGLQKNAVELKSGESVAEQSFPVAGSDVGAGEGSAGAADRRLTYFCLRPIAARVPSEMPARDRQCKPCIRQGR